MPLVRIASHLGTTGWCDMTPSTVRQGNVDETSFRLQISKGESSHDDAHSDLLQTAAAYRR